MALRTFFGYTAPTGLERMEDEIVAEARRLWRVRYAHGQYRFMPRAELEQILRSDLRRILHRWRVVIGPARWRLYYGPFDLAGALTMVRSRVSKAACARSPNMTSGTADTSPWRMSSTPCRFWGESSITG
jgi:hypothetical protein